MTGLLLETGLDRDQRELAETVRSSADSLLSLIDDILDFSKIGAGRLALEAVDFRVRDCVEDAVEMVVERAFEQGVEVVAHVASDVPDKVSGDAGRLRQVR